MPGAGYVVFPTLGTAGGTAPTTPVSSPLTSQTFTASDTVSVWDTIIIVNSTTAATVTLPKAEAGDVGKKVIIRNIGDGVVTPADGGNSLSGSQALNKGESIVFYATAPAIVHTVSDRIAPPTPLEQLNPWAAKEEVHQYTERSLLIGNSLVALSSSFVGTRTTNDDFDIDEAKKWTKTGQNIVEDFPPETLVVQGFQILVNGQAYQSEANRITGKNFDATENVLTNWTPLSLIPIANRVNLSNFTVSEVIGDADETVDVAQVIEFTQVTPNVLLDIPKPTDLAMHKGITFENSAASTETVHFNTIPHSSLAPGESKVMWWNGDSWRPIVSRTAGDLDIINYMA